MALRIVAVVSTALFVGMGSALAQSYPSRPLTMVIPFAVGGPTDVLGRLIGARMGEVLGQQIVIENVGGAGGMTGSTRVKNAAPDGYTMGVGTVGTHAQNQTLYRNPAYNSLTDFAPVGLIADVPIVLIVPKDLPVKDFEEFLAYAKANQSRMSYGSAGMGSATHLCGVLLNSMIEVSITHVPYRGTGPAMQDLQAGRIDYLCEIITAAKPQIQNGTVRALAAMSEQRSPVLPDLPTAAEQGIKIEAYTWNAIFMPKGVPAEAVEKVNDALSQAVDTPAVRERLTLLGANLAPPERRSAGYLGRFLKSEIDKWAAPIRASGAQVD